MSALVATQQGCATQLTPYVAVTDLHEQTLVFWKLHSVAVTLPVLGAKKSGLIFFAHSGAAPTWMLHPPAEHVTFYGNHPNVGAAILEMTTGVAVPSRGTLKGYLYSRSASSDGMGLFVVDMPWSGGGVGPVHGFSGGPVTDASGNVVGVTLAEFMKPAAGYHLGDVLLFPASLVVREYDRLKATGKYPWMKGEPRVAGAASRPVAAPAPASAAAPMHYDTRLGAFLPRASGP